MNSTRMFEIKKRLFPALIDSRQMTNYLRRKGVDVGHGTIFYDAGSQIIDVTRPCLLEIGEYCKITGGVTILTHDYSRSVLRRKYGPLLGEGKKTIIGNNVFVGMNSTVLMGSRVGDNVIIGAGSVISGYIPDDCVVAGNPAKIIRSIDEHFNKRKSASVYEAFEYVTVFEKKYGRLPTIKEMDPFYWLFLERDLDIVQKNGLTMHLGGDDEKQVEEAFINSAPIFNGYEEFINEWKKQK